MTANGRKYSIFFGLNGQRAPSRVAAWRTAMAEGADTSNSRSQGVVKHLETKPEANHSPKAKPEAKVKSDAKGKAEAKVKSDTKAKAEASVERRRKS